MRILVLVVTIWSLVSAKPEMYKEKEDFQYSRSSTDEGNKSGYYGAQRGNMGGNYERAHNMDSLAQHQMSGVVRQVEGELGDTSKARAGSVYTSANSRGIYGTGVYDLSNLSGRSFQEGTALGDSRSQASMIESGYNAGSSYSNAQSSRASHSDSRYNSAYQQSSNIGLSSNNLESNSRHHSASGGYNYDREAANLGYQSNSGYERQNSYDHTNTQSSNGFGSNAQTRLIAVGTPARVIIRPGTTITIPVAAQTFNTAHSSTYDQNAINSEAESLANGEIQSQNPTSDGKHYESAYSYRKEWEKHDSRPVAVHVAIPTVSQNSELYDAEQLSQNTDRYETNRLDSHRSHSSNAYSGYHANSNSASSGQSRYQTDYNNQQHGSSFRSNINAASSSAADANVANVNTELDSRPKSYQSSYSYHKSWERQGDPYVIVPSSNSAYENQASQRLTSGASNSHQYDSQYRRGCLVECDPNGHLRVARSTYNKPSVEFENIGNSQDQFQNNRELVDFGQQAQTTDDLNNFGQVQNSEGLINFAQLQHNNGGLMDFGQQTQNSDDFMYIGQQTQGNEGFVDFGQQPQNNDKLDIFASQTQTTGDLEDFGQLTQNTDNLHDFNQNIQNQGNINAEEPQASESLIDFGQQSQNSEKLEDFGQQAQNSEKLEDFGQLAQNSEKLGDFGQQAQSSEKLGDIGQQAQNREKLEDFGQPLNNGDTLRYFNQHTQNHENFNIGQQTLNNDQQQQSSQNLEDFGQQAQSNQNLYDFGQQVQSSDNLANFNQQHQERDQIGNNRQQIHNQWSHFENFGQQTSQNWNHFEHTGQEIQNNYERQNAFGNNNNQNQEQVKPVWEQPEQDVQTPSTNTETYSFGLESLWGKIDDLEKETVHNSNKHHSTQNFHTNIQQEHSFNTESSSHFQSSSQYHGYVHHDSASERDMNESTVNENTRVTENNVHGTIASDSNRGDIEEQDNEPIDIGRGDIGSDIDAVVKVTATTIKPTATYATTINSNKPNNYGTEIESVTDEQDLLHRIQNIDNGLNVVSLQEWVNRQRLHEHSDTTTVKTTIKPKKENDYQYLETPEHIQQFNTQHIEDFGQTNDNLYQQNQNTVGNVEDLGQQVQTAWDSRDNLQQTQDGTQQIENFGSYGSFNSQGTDFYHQEQLAKKKIINKETAALQKENSAAPIEVQLPDINTSTAPTTESKGFWSSVGNKFSNAKDKVVSWFRS